MSKGSKTTPKSIGGIASAPPSKSVTQRAYALAALCEGKTQLHYPSKSADCERALQIIQDFGCEVNWKNKHTVEIEGSSWKNRSHPLHVHCGESGLGMRMFASLAALFSQEVVLNAAGSLKRRPMDFFDSVFPALGVDIVSQKGFPPLHITGPMRGGNTQIDGGQSSQYLTGLLMALSQSEQDSTLEVLGLKSKPYIDLTLKMMNHFGLEAYHQEHTRFNIPGNQRGTASTLTVDGDWSGGAFLFVAAAIGGDLEIRGLDNQFPQADEAILDVLSQAGIVWRKEGSSFFVCQGPVQGFDFDATDCPDLFPPLVSLAVFAGETSRIKGAHRLVHKESNRAASLQAVFGKLGHSITIEGDTMVVSPGRWKAATVSSHNDHRLAMAAAMAQIGGHQLRISQPDVVSKSWPSFWEDLAALKYYPA